MEAVHKTLIYRGDGGPYRKLMPEKKLFCSGKVQDESKYVELDNLLDLKPECSKTVKVTFTGEGNHLAIFNCKNGVGATEEKAADEKKLVAGDLSDSLEFTSSSESSRESDLSTECPTGAQDYEELQYTDIFLNRRAESPGSLTSDELAAPPAATTTAASGTAGVSAGEEHEDEAHYITTHEIQLCELDHDVDCDFGQGSCWDFEEDNLACPFVDYASFDSDQAAALEGTAGVAEPHAAPVPTATGRVAVSTTRESDPLCHTDARGSSLGAPSQHQNGGSGTSAGQIHLSIKATSRAINEPSNARKPLENSGCHAERLGGGGGDMSQDYAFTSAGAKVGRGDEGGKCFIAAPRRLHITGRKDLGEFHSSGASSAVSELDDADKEVRSLTARAFRSLACPYLDALQFSTSSDSSASFTEGVNRWSAFVDLKYGSLASAAGRKRSTFEFNQSGSPPSCAVLLNGGAAPDPPKSKPKPKPDQVNGVPPDAEQLLTLTETFNFRCNVTDERRAKLVQNVSGSRSTDEVTDALPRELGTGASQPACKAGEAMEGTQQKAKFASSLLKNVISKKMQFEQERKMERGEISETTSSSSSGLSPTLDRLISGEPRLLRRQGSRFSEASSDHTVVSTDEPGEGEPPGPDAAKGLLLRSHNSAFRSWRDGESEQMGDKGEQRDEEPSDGKATKMSHLFVPSIQSAGKEAEAAKPTGHLQYSSRAVSYLEGGGGGGGAEEPSPAPGVPKCEGASKSPEIKISLRSVKESRANPFNIAKLLTPNIGSQTKVAEDCKSQGLPPNTFKGQPLERVPQFTVRDIRDNKCKLQTPIHQVRDVRKLVKSSYNFGAVDGSDASAEQKSTSQGGLGKTGSVSPIVIKCQSVNTKNNLQQDPELPKAQPGEEVALSAHLLEGATIMFHRTTGRMPPPAAVKPPQKTEPFEPAGVHIEAKAFKRKPENPTDASEKKPETTLVNQAALEKLKAAVKTMEQLYVFDRNEWKRKTEPHPITDSHVLSLIASEEGGHGEGKLSTSKEESLPPQQRLVRRNSYPNAERSTPKPTLACDISIKKGNKENLKTPNKEDRERPGMATQPGSAIVTKNALHTSHNPKSASTANGPFSASKGQQPVFNTKGLVPKFPHIPMSLKIGPSKATPEGLGKAEGTGQEPKSTAACDSENYLTIPVKPHPSDAKAAPGSQEQSSGYLFTTPGVRTHDASPSHSDFKRLEDTRQSPKRSSVVMETRSPETPTATIYHHSLPIAMSGVQPQVICFSPSVPPAPAIEPFQPTQRKMLLDPTTGHYYLVDTPVQPATKRLFDPETGQYVDIPMPQQPVTPVPVPVSPIALSPGAYGTTYMIYPSFLPTTTVLPARTLHTQLSSHSEGDDVDKTNSKEGAQSGTTGDVAYMESPYYFATGKSVPVQTTMQHVTARAPKGLSEGKPVISITSQQGPRIIAPPSFDGTTMSFVVEHR
ncbi:uncharacterized protein C4orf54 homolog [Polypterus senegalus]|uniref:uncharacterized protein C4orf54 homolog n=1 Tax=Polypterus senegalus TaxID=55291 RepID=UPI0019663E8A|nr:uncharacterized protein C4orf54 homolog [Polypterus senegalus]XP_039615746.1 uncharacterized protein C4orf54 homolog [Polypterus senegalus]